MRQITLRIISSILLIAIMLSTLSSCFIFGKGDEPDGGTGETPGGDTTGGEDPASGLFWGVGADTYLVIGEGIVTVPDTLSSAIFETTGKVPVYKAAGSEATEHEIIIGEADRNVSRAAYRLLEEKSELGYSGYVICSSGTSVAIAFTEWESLELAVEAFLDGFYKVSDGKIILESAVLAEKAFNLFEYYGELDEQIMEERWATLEKYVDGTGYNGKATVDAFKKLYSLYSDDAYFWLANLWDPVTGGFYYSNSARDTVSFLPDIESTRQALDFIRYSGMTSSLSDSLPQQMQNSIIDFTNSLYDPASGNYYHPQWANYAYTDERLGRDYTNARSVLSALRYRAVSSLTPRLDSSVSESVSKVSPTASLPHLQSKEKFIAYLNSQNWNDSYTSGNRIAAQGALIDKAGLMETCLDFFDSIQNPTTGMWSPNRDDDAVNGYLKISAIYASFANKYNRTINYASEAADTCIQVLTSDKAPATVCWVYNVWYSLGNIISLLKSTGKANDAALADQIRERLREDAPRYIEIAFEKYAPFRKDDGSFSFSPQHSSANSQGMPVCVSNRVEGDVNATYISMISVPARIFAALGYTDAEVSLFTKNDFKIFINEINNMGEIVKTNTEFGGPLGFNGDTVKGLFYSTDNTELDTIPDEVEEDGYAYAYILDDNGENVLCYGKNEVSDGFEPKLSFRLLEGEGNCYVYEMDIKFKGATIPKNKEHTKFTMYGGGGRFWFMLAYTNDKGQLLLNSITDPLAVLEKDTWYNLRFEYYTDSAEASTQKVCKVYVDGKYVGDGGVVGSAGNDKSFYRCMLEFMARGSEIGYYLDNVNTVKEEKPFVAPPPPDFGDATGKYYTDATIKNTRFDYDAEDAKLPTLGASNDSTELYRDAEEGVLVFKKNRSFTGKLENSIKFSIALSNSFWNQKNKTTVFEFDLSYTDIKATTPMKLRFGNDFAISKNGDSLILSHKYLDKTVSMDLGTSPDTWSNIRLEQYWYHIDAEGNGYSLVKVFVNNEYKGETKTAYSSATGNASIYILASETEAVLKLDNVLLAHVDMPYTSEGTSPIEPDETYESAAEILAVKGGASGIVVVMHDDGDIASARILDSLYERYGVRGDVALVASRVIDLNSGTPKAETLNFWKTLINTGRWNITNHSYTHTYWEDADALTRELVTSQAILRNLFPTRRVLTFAYPGFSAQTDSLGRDAVYESAMKLAADYYIGARDYDGRNSSLSGIDWLDVNSTSIGESWASSAISDINSAANDGKLSVVFMHRVVETSAEAEADQSATTRAKMEEIVSLISGYAKEGRIWNAFLEEAILYLKEAECASVAIEGDDKALTVSLTDTLDDEIYNFPLTVRVTVPRTWAYVKVAQGDGASYLKAYECGGRWVVDAPIVPDGGNANLVPVNEHDVPPSTEKELQKEELVEVEFNAGDAVGDYYKDPDMSGVRVDYDSLSAMLPTDTDAKELLSIKDGYLLLDDGDQEAVQKYIRYKSALPADYKTLTSLVTVLELDMNIKQVYSSYPIQIKLGDKQLTLYYVSFGGTHYLAVQNSDKTYTSLGVKAGEWFTLRLELYYNVMTGEEATPMLKLFVNNKYVWEYNLVGATPSAAAIIYLTGLERGKTSDADLMLDNIFLGHFDKTFVSEKPEEPEAPEEYVDKDGKGDYYLSDKKGLRVDFDDENTGAPAFQSGNTFATLEKTDGALSFKSLSGGESTFRFVYSSSTAGYEKLSYVAEADICFKGVTGEKFGWIILANGGYQAHLTLSQYNGDIYIYSGRTANGISVAQDEWVNLRFECIFADNVIKVYVNNVEAGSISVTFSENGSQMMRIGLANGTNKGAEMLIDNVYLGFDEA